MSDETSGERRSRGGEKTAELVAKPTLKDVAKIAGVAVNTVSSILNNRSDSWASQETRTRVLLAARQLGYQPNQAARGLRLKRYHTIGGIFSDMTNPFYALLVRYLQDALDEHGYDLIVEESEIDTEREVKCLNSLVSRQIDALICSGLDYQANGGYLAEINRQIPVMVFGGTEALQGADTIDVDFKSSLFHAVDYLRSLGHHRISYINAYKVERDVSKRTDFFFDALRKYQLPVSDDSYMNCGFYALSHVRETAREWYRKFTPATRPSALICLNDLTAIGVSRGLLDLNLRIPTDVSLIGIDNVEVAAYLPFPLTTIAQPVEEMAAFCVKRLIERIEDRRPMESVHRVVPSRLIIRESTGPAL